MPYTNVKVPCSNAFYSHLKVSLATTSFLSYKSLFFLSPEVPVFCFLEKAVYLLPAHLGKLNGLKIDRAK